MIINNNNKEDVALIVCPKCEAHYHISPANLMEKPQTFRCSECKNEWIYTPTKNNQQTSEQKLALEKLNPMNPFEQINQPIQIENLNAIYPNITKPNNPGFFKKLFSKSLSWFMIIAISANIIFWILYFVKYSTLSK